MPRALTYAVASLVLMVSLAAAPVSYAADNNNNALKLAVHPYLAASTIVEKFSPLADYLSKEIGRPVIIVVAKDYATHIDWIGQGAVDMAYMGPASYVTLTESYGLRPLLAVLELNGKTTFQGIIIKSASSPIKDISELRGKRFAFGDPNSTMSHMVPRYMLYKAGIDVSDLDGHEFLKNHENVALAVLSGVFDAGCIKPETYEKYRDKGVSILALTPEIKEHLFIARAGLDDKIITAIRSAMTRLASAPDGLRVLESLQFGVTGLSPVKDSDYENLREIITTLRGLGVSP